MPRRWSCSLLTTSTTSERTRRTSGRGRDEQLEPASVRIAMSTGSPRTTRWRSWKGLIGHGSSQRGRSSLGCRSPGNPRAFEGVRPLRRPTRRLWPEGAVRRKLHVLGLHGRRGSRGHARVHGQALMPVFEGLNEYDATMHFNGQSTVTLERDRATGEPPSRITCSRSTGSAGS